MFRLNADRVLTLVLSCLTMIAGSLAIFVTGFITISAWPALSRVGIDRFVLDSAWHPAGGASASFGMLPMLGGSILVTAGAMLLATPFGVLSALYSQYYAADFPGACYRRIIELLAGVPSIVFGFWGLVVVVPLVNRWHPPGHSLLAGSLVLALMIMPTVALTSEAAFRAVPDAYLRAAAALGLNRWAMISEIVLPVSRRGILTGLLLAAARAIGETMVVVMICGNKTQYPGSVFDPVRTVTANIALEMGYATSQHRSALFATGLLLVLMIGCLIGVTELIAWRSGQTSHSAPEGGHR